ncbi:ABC transporter substrate-binding protein [Corynebacterium sp. CCM 9185]|uniref:heme/hemin ABC transporter substrate-binding protein n=1 Tax=Corynebacterium marambiense TaxID=2765364 RepID=UPI001E5E3655|nr:ABC transporter substrate-binding protein [Corynebacterium marambiense]MCK7662219.1 ABC transporter substrate-binding protein [Corynebacterium marambiense]MCX7541488.1 ABC transporter substrate-binding protein [Corynebacterium marambiense]
MPDPADLPDPRSLTGVNAVTGVGEPIPVTEDPQPQLPVELTDADGYDVVVDDVSRILALDLYGAYTKTLIGLGMRDAIIGRTVSSDEASLANLPVVTQGGHNINVEAVLELNPSLVIIDHSIGPREAIDQIREVGVPVVVMEPLHTVDGIHEDIVNLGGVVGLPDDAEVLAERSVKEYERAVEDIRTITPENPLRMAFLYARGTGGVFFILGEEDGVNELIKGVGGIDVATENGIRTASPANAEALAKLNPEVFIMMEKGLESTNGIDGLLERPGVAQTVAGQNRRIVTVPDGQALAFGPQTGDLLERLAIELYAPESK